MWPDNSVRNNDSFRNSLTRLADEARDAAERERRVAADTERREALQALSAANKAYFDREEEAKSHTQPLIAP